MSAPTAIVTGASSGIGDATARRLAELGYTVYAAARRTDRMAALELLGVRVVATDVTDDAALVALVERVVAETGRVDVLVNNAGYGAYGALEDVPQEEARRQFDVNVFALARLTQLVLPHMRARRDGCVVNVSSMGGKMWEPMGSWYHASKFAVEGMSDSLRTEVAEFGIRVVVIQPGAIRTEWSGIAGGSTLERSGSGPYRAQAQTVSRALSAFYSSGISSGPEVVAEAVGRAVRSRRPRTRYAVGGGARVILLLQRVLTDRGFDRAFRLSFRVLARRG